MAWIHYLTRWRAASLSSDSCFGQPVSGAVDKSPWWTSAASSWSSRAPRQCRVGGAVEVWGVVQEEAAKSHTLVIHKQASNLFGHADQATLVVGVLDVLLLVAQLKLWPLDGSYQYDVVYHISTVPTLVTNGMSCRCSPALRSQMHSIHLNC